MQLNIPQEVVLPLVGGLLALLLLLLMLRFALRPKRRPVTPPGTILNLPIEPGISGRESTGVLGGDLRDTAGRGVAGTAGPGVLAAGELVAEEQLVAPFGGPGADSAQQAFGAARGIDSMAGGTASAAGTPARTEACPKCGGRFLDGEVEGPLVMVDGVARDEFRPLLTARECRACGYLELYTRAPRLSASG